MACSAKRDLMLLFRIISSMRTLISREHRPKRSSYAKIHPPTSWDLNRSHLSRSACKTMLIAPCPVCLVWERNGPVRRRQFYQETYDEWVTHEVWWGQNKALFTIWPKNEEMLQKPHGIAYVSLEDRAMHILSQKKYWHVGGSADGKWAVGDTFDGELYLINGETGQAKLLTQGHRPRGATVHPHPSFSPDGSSVLFCSEKRGNWDLFLVQVQQ